MNYKNSYATFHWVPPNPAPAKDYTPIEYESDDKNDTSYDFDDEDYEKLRTGTRYFRPRIRDEDTPFGLDASDF